MTTTAVSRRTADQDWGAPRSASPSIAGPIALLLVPLLAVSLLAGFLVAPAVGLLILMIGVAVLAWYLDGAGQRWLKQVGARPSGPSEARVVNLCAGLAGDAGFPPPTVWVLEDAKPNAFAVWHRGPHVGVTSGLLETFTRTETEAAVAHSLVRLHDEGPTPTRLYGLASLGLPVPSGPPGRLDSRTAALTRYPPALASALEKAAPKGGKDSTLWFVGRGEEPQAVSARAEAVRDL